MQISDIVRVEVDWLEQFSSPPQVTFVLKRDRRLNPSTSFRWNQRGDFFYAEHENEVQFMAHDRGDHTGYGGRKFQLTMSRYLKTPQYSQCSAGCNYNPATNIMTLAGPWSSNSMYCSKVFRPVVNIATLEGPNREAIVSPERYHRLRKRGHGYAGLPYSSHYTLEFAQEALAVHAPHLELYNGDFGWYVVRKGDQPKCPREKPEGYYAD